MRAVFLLVPALVACNGLGAKTQTPPPVTGTGTTAGSPGGTPAGTTGGTTSSSTAPTAVDDAAVLDQGGEADIPVLDNDSDPDDGLDVATVSLVDDPLHGTVQISPAGNVRYVHDGSVETTDSFTYTVDDLSGQTSNVATVDLSITYLFPPGVCQNGANSVSTAPLGNMMLCDDPTNTTCEEDFEAMCPISWHLCTMDEFNAYNDGWTEPTSTYERALGVIWCRSNGEAGHFTVPDSSSGNTDLGQDEVFNCYYGTSNAVCPSPYGCNEQEAYALCCAPMASCGNGVVDGPEEQCDDGNASDADDCLSTCTWRVPTDHGFSGTNCQ